MSESISSINLFKTLVNTGVDVTADSKVSAKRMELALGALSWDNQGVSVRERNQTLSWLVGHAGSLSKSAKHVALSFLRNAPLSNSTHTGTLRTADAYRFTLSALQSGVTNTQISEPEIRTVLSVLGKNPAPARLAEVNELTKSSALSEAAKKEVTRWSATNRPYRAPAELSSKLEPITKDLLWLSESERKISDITLGTAGPKLSVSQFRKLLGEDSKVPVEKLSIDDVFRGQIPETDGLGGPLDANATQMRQLKQVLQENLQDLQAFKVGLIERDLYIVGRTTAGELAGVVTRVVET